MLGTDAVQRKSVLSVYEIRQRKLQKLYNMNVIIFQYRAQHNKGERSPAHSFKGVERSFIVYIARILVNKPCK